MKAVQGNGRAENLTIVDAPVIQPGPHQALVHVKAFAVNGVDLLQRSTKAYPLPSSASYILGIDFSGVIVALGTPPSSTWKIGDCVFGFAPQGGAYAEYVVVELDRLMLKPSSMSYAEAASLPSAWLSAIFLLREKAHFQRREKVAILDAATPTGFAAVQLAQILGCRRVYAAVRTPTSAPAGLALLESLPDEVVPVLLTQVSRAVKSVDPQGIHAIIALTADPSATTNIPLTDNSVVVLSHIQPVSRATFDIDLLPFVYQGITIAGSPHPRAMPGAMLNTLQDYFVEHVLPQIASRKLPMHIAPASFKLNDIAAAHKWVETHAEAGKVVVEI